MGYIKTESDQNQICNYNFTRGSEVRLNISQWRILKFEIYNDNQGTFIILENCRIFFLKNITIEQIHIANYENSTINGSIFYIKNALTCSVCSGLGTVDWLQNIIKRKQGDLDFRDFRRDKKGNIKRVEVGPDYERSFGGDLFVSSPIKKKYLHYCPKCYGSGLRILEKADLKIVKEFQLEKN